MSDLPDLLADCKIFPCVPLGKLPATKDGWKEATSDAAQIAKWLAVNPNFNWACATGLSGLFVIDVDPNGLDYWAKLLERDSDIRAAVDAAFQVRTPRGGLHIYFRGEGPSTASRIAAGIDTRGGFVRGDKIVSGGYVLLPGSRTDKGGYTALPGGAINPLPDCIKAIIPERAKSETKGLAKDPTKDLPVNVARVVDMLKKNVADGKVAIQGQGGDTFTFKTVASVLDKAISPALAFDLLWDNWNPHCQPPWDDWALEEKIHNAFEHGEDTKSGAKGIQANADAFAKFEGQIFESSARERRSRFEPMWLRDARKDVRPARWLIPNILPDVGVGILYGLSGTYKTFIALDWALSLAHGIAGQWGAPPVKNTVLFFAGESSYALQQERVDAWCAKHELNAEDADFVIVRGVPAYGDAEGWAEVREGVSALHARPALIVIDTLTRLMTGLDENNNNDGKLAMKFCEELSENYGCFVLSIGHTGKDENRGLRGAQVFIDNSDAVFSLKGKAKGSVAMTVKKLKEVDIPAEPYYLMIKESAKSIVLELQAEAPADPIRDKTSSKYSWASVEEVVKVLTTLGGSASQAILIAEIAKANNVERPDVRKQLNRSDLAWLHTGDKWAIAQEFDL